MMMIPSRQRDCKFTEKYSKARLDGMRQRGDELADRVVADLHATHGLVNIRDLLNTVKSRAQDPMQSQIYRDFMADTLRMPSWVDVNKVERGQQVQAAYSIPMGVSLFAGSLVGGAMFQSAAMVTAQAGNLTANPTTRVTETALIIAHLAFPGELVNVTGKAREALTRVRLLHGGLRHWLVASKRYTRTDEVCINQHDLGITLSLFGYVNVRSLGLMGIHLRDEEVDAYMHMWRFAGFILGIEEELLPVSYADQQEFFLASCVEQAKPEWVPRATTFVLDAFAREATEHSWVPFWVAQTFLHQITRYLSGNEWCEGMQIEDMGDNHWSIWGLKALGMGTAFVVHWVPFGEVVVRRGNLAMMERDIEKFKKLKGGGELGGSVNVAPDGTKPIPAPVVPIEVLSRL
jgi:hypothetical protein